MPNSIHSAVWDWLLTCPNIKKLFFNFSDTNYGDTAIVPTDTIKQTYIDGTEERKYAFDLVQFLPLTFEPNDTGNIAMLDAVEAIAEWVQTKDAARQYPTFPTGCTVTEVTCDSGSAGYVAAQNDKVARYQIPFVIYYIKEGA